jgi:hypothetical protein
MAAQEKKFVSLGSNCSIAYQLNIHQLRCEAYPFDFCSTPINKLLKVFHHSFNNFHKLSKVKISSNHKRFTDNKDSYVLKNSYGIRFAHEIVDEKEIEFFQERLKCRIERFTKLLNPTFIRIETENLKYENFIKKYTQLLEILKTLFQDFKFIIISKYEIIHENIIWIQLKEFHSDWKYDHLDWTTIFDL